MEEAKIKRVEHQAAAERHGALTQRYAERISRLEEHLGKAVLARSNMGDLARSAYDDVLSAAALP